LVVAAGRRILLGPCAAAELQGVVLTRGERCNVGDEDILGILYFDGERLTDEAKHTWYVRSVFFVRDCDASSAFGECVTTNS